MIELGAEICTDFEAASSREWLETNGIGGYASSTISGANSRRYHGLLTAAMRPPLGRLVLLSKFDETVVIDGERFEISCNQYPGNVHPRGFKFLANFRLDPFPVWSFEINGHLIEKTIFMVNGENTTVCRWRHKNPGIEDANAKLEIELKPLLAFRDHHHLRHLDPEFNGAYQVAENLLTIAPCPAMPTLHLAHNAAAIEKAGFWYRNFEYAIEHERGFDYHEDLYQPFLMRFDLSGEAFVIASTQQRENIDIQELAAQEVERRTALISTAGADDEFTSQLVSAASQFIVARGSGKTVIAGYPWFSDWGRDTMIALNGLTLVTNRPDVAKSILIEFSKHISEGMIPNRFPDAGEIPDYNTVDATLWFFEAIRAYVEKTGDYDLIRDEFYDKFVDIIDWHIRGTRYRIHVDTDGLLYAGEPGLQLTWMDAKIGDWVVTPRTGKAVEIQALWYNALRIMADFSTRFGDVSNKCDYAEMAEIASDSFNGQFWNEQGACLFDVIGDGEKDASIRPNQIFAVSLPHTMLDPEKARRVVDTVEAELLTPVGLRSLSPNDPRYAGIYVGSPLTRDGSYHQGTVWGWPIGHFVDAYRKVHPDDPFRAERIDNIVRGFSDHLVGAAIGQVSEIFDGDDPYTPRGCPAQAWSVAEILRIRVAHLESRS